MKQEFMKTYCLRSLARYWASKNTLIAELPVIDDIPRHINNPVRLVPIALPYWARDVGVNGCLLVPEEVAEHSRDWKEINWWYVAFWYLNSLAERKFEEAHGPIHSYSFKLQGWDPRMWEHAWVNRIALFFRCWAAHLEGSTVREIFGEGVKAEIYITHDLDATRKTWAIRFKQTAFHCFNALRTIGRGEFTLAIKKLWKAICFLLNFEDYRHFEKLIIDRADTNITKQIINVYGGDAGFSRTLKQTLFDPAYDCAAPELVQNLKSLSQTGIEIGLHQSFEAWKAQAKMSGEVQRLTSALNKSVVTCRQHWLRFSYEHTWLAQSQSGFQEDTTLGFNDRPGFRNGAALAFNPVSWKSSDTLPLVSVPIILMDSHLYDYQPLDDEERTIEIDSWLSELEFVGGQASILWHPHTLGQDYGWLDGFNTLLTRLKTRRVESVE